MANSDVQNGNQSHGRASGRTSSAQGIGENVRNLSLSSLLNFANDQRYANGVLKPSQAMQYEKVCGAYPAKVLDDDFLAPPRDVCGPDVTDLIANEIQREMEYWSANPYSVIPQRRLYDVLDNWDAGMTPNDRPFDLKYGRVVVDGGSAICPEGENCESTLTFCGFCVSDYVPGNIAYGFLLRIAGIPRPVIHGAGRVLPFENRRTSDTHVEWSSRAWTVGIDSASHWVTIATAEMRRTGRSPASPGEGRSDLVRAAICAELAKAVKKKTVREFPCDPCPGKGKRGH